MQWVVPKSMVPLMLPSDLFMLVLVSSASTSTPLSRSTQDGLPTSLSMLQERQEKYLPRHSRVLVLSHYLSARQMREALHTKARENYLLSTVAKKHSPSIIQNQITILLFVAKQVLHTFPTGMDLAQRRSQVRLSRELHTINLEQDSCSTSPTQLIVEHIITTPVLSIYSTESAMVLLLRQSLILGLLLTTRTRSLKTTRIASSPIWSSLVVATTSITDS